MLRKKVKMARSYDRALLPFVLGCYTASSRQGGWGGNYGHVDVFRLGLLSMLHRGVICLPTKSDDRMSKSRQCPCSAKIQLWPGPLRHVIHSLSPALPVSARSVSVHIKAQIR